MWSHRRAVATTWDGTRRIPVSRMCDVAWLKGRFLLGPVRRFPIAVRRRPPARTADRQVDDAKSLIEAHLASLPAARTAPQDVRVVFGKDHIDVLAVAEKLKGRPHCPGHLSQWNARALSRYHSRTGHSRRTDRRQCFWSRGGLTEPYRRAVHLRQSRQTPVFAIDCIDVDGTPITLHENRFSGIACSSSWASNATAARGSSSSNGPCGRSPGGRGT